MKTKQYIALAREAIFGCDGLSKCSLNGRNTQAQRDWTTESLNILKELSEKDGQIH